MKLYEYLYEGGTVEFDLNETRARFNLTAGGVQTKNKFTRKINSVKCRSDCSESATRISTPAQEQS